uniref:Uncharacterized protein n=1 Tax=Rhizophora mucronata TaxID=61149 RepID=A0A2P2K4V2_RHIMU
MPIKTRASFFIGTARRHSQCLDNSAQVNQIEFPIPIKRKV